MHVQPHEECPHSCKAEADRMEVRLQTGSEARNHRRRTEVVDMMHASSICLTDRNTLTSHRKRITREIKSKDDTSDQEQEDFPHEETKMNAQVQVTENSRSLRTSSEIRGTRTEIVRVHTKGGSHKVFKYEECSSQVFQGRSNVRNSKTPINVLERTDGFFKGINALFIGGGVSPKRLQVWKGRIESLGGYAMESSTGVQKHWTHVFAVDQTSLINCSDSSRLKWMKNAIFLKFEWIEDCLKEGKILPHEAYKLQNPFKKYSSISCFPTHEELMATDSSTFECKLSELPSRESEDMERNVDKIDNVCEEAKQRDICRDSNDFESEMKPTGQEHLEQHMQKCSETSVSTLLKYEPPDVNQHITKLLKEMSHIYEEVLGDEWRSTTYRKAVTKIEKMPYKISNSADVNNIFGVGSSLSEKIKEILCTGRLQKLENLKSDPQVQIIQQFASVWGIGPKQAQRLYQQGHRNIEDLSRETSLSHMAQIGVAYFHDLNLRIPRAEVEDAEKYVRKIAEEVCPGISIRVTGSFRRGHATCGDIDFLVTHPDGYSHRGFLVKMVRILQSTGFITDSLHCTDHCSKSVKNKVDTFMGICRIPNYQQHRRIDIKVYSKESYAFALVYFTGNDVLNRKIRYAAQRKGYKLNDCGLFLRVGGKNGISSEISIPCETEEEVFDKLGFPYYEPQERNL